MDVITLTDERGADDGAADALHLQVVITSGDAVGGVERKLQGAAVGVSHPEAEGVAVIFESGELGAVEVDQGAAGLELHGQGGVLAVFEGQARGDEPLRGGRLGRAGVEIIGHFQVGGGVEEEVAVVADLHEGRGRNPVGALDQGRDGEGRGSDKEARHGGCSWGYLTDR